jgi:hypothetical protein
MFTVVKSLPLDVVREANGAASPQFPNGEFLSEAKGCESHELPWYRPTT